MAIVSFANLDQNFDQSLELVTITGAGLLVTQPESFAWTSGTVPVNGVYFEGTDFTYALNTPTGGIATTFKLDLDNDGAGAGQAELQITGLSFDLSVLEFGGLTADEQNDLVWRTVLAGNDTVNLGSAHGINFSGDGRNVGAGLALIGGADVITGGISAGGVVIGDFHTVAAGGAVIGGDDVITLDTMPVWGDVGFVNGFLAGGNDTITLTGAGVCAGDAHTVAVGGTAVGGDDSIRVRDSGSGDASEVYGVLQGATTSCAPWREARA
jgi:hypothetical protein